MLSLEEQQERDASLARLKITTYREEDKGYVFISYKSDDWREVFENKVFELQDRKMRIYSDKQFDDSNHPWLENMDKNIKYSSAVILFISEKYLKSYATFIEVLTAIKYKKQIVPVYLSDEDYFEKLGGMRALEDDLVKMNATEADRLKMLIQSKDNPQFSDVMDSIRNEYLMKLGSEKFSVMDLVSSFKKILKDSGNLQNNYFYKPIDTLINTIREIIAENEKILDVFEDEDPEETSINVTISEEKEDAIDDGEALEAGSIEAEPIGTTRGKSSTGDITYTIYGREYTDNQSNMMLNVFAKVLKNHPDKVNTLPEQAGMNCVSKIDYTEEKNRNDQMPSYFRICEYFPIADGICVGTAYSIQDKMKKIARLIEICGEEREIFQSEAVELPEIKRAKNGSGTEEITKGKSSTGDITYSIYGKEYTDNQSNMMLNVFAKVLKNHPDKVKTLPEQAGMNCVSKIDYTDKANRGDNMPSYFRICEYFPIADGICVGTAYGIQDKMKKIARLFEICEEDWDIFQSEDVSLPEAKRDRVGKEDGTKIKKKRNFLEE